MAPRQTILLRGNAREEAGIATGAVVTPGDLLEYTGTARGVRRHSVAGGAIAPIMFARASHEAEGGITDNIPQNGEVILIFPEQGAKINCRTAASLTRGAEVTSAGNGQVRARTAGEALLGIADGPTDTGRIAIIVGASAPTESI